MGERVVRSRTTRDAVGLALIVASRETNGPMPVSQPGTEDSRNDGTVLAVEVGS